MSSIFELSERLLSPPSSPVTSNESDHSNQMALEKLALELSMFDLSSPGTEGLSHNSADLATALMSIQQQQHSPNDGMVAGSTLNAFTSMLGHFNNSPAVHFDDRSKKSQNMTECVPVPSSEHVAEIVGRQGKSCLSVSKRGAKKYINDVRLAQYFYEFQHFKNKKIKEVN